MRRFVKDFFVYPFQRDKTNNKVNQLMTSLFKEYPADFWTNPTFKKIFIAPLLIVYYMFSEGKKNKSE